MSGVLREQLLRALSEPSRQRLAGRELDGWLRRCAARAAERGLELDEALLAGALARAIDGGVEPEQVDAADLYLAAVCARGDRVGVRRFESEYGPDLDRAIAKSPTLGLAAPEFRQLVLDRLFVREGEGPPRIAKYLGRGSLKSWLRVMASRLIIDLSRRRAPPSSSDGELSEKLGASEDPEIDYLRHAYGPALDTAFTQAIASLSVRERNLLRQRYLHEVSADALATMYGVHRSTLFLWLDKARAALLSHVRRALAERLPGDQLESVVGMLGSKLELSVRRMLDSRLEADAD